MKTHMEPIKPEDFTRIKNDVNGNPRHVCHFLHLDVHGWESNIGLSERYALAVKLAKPYRDWEEVPQQAVWWWDCFSGVRRMPAIVV